MVLCTVKDEQRLFLWAEKLKAKGFNAIEWREPDMNNELTAIATEAIYGDDRRHFKNLQLMKEEGLA